MVMTPCLMLGSPVLGHVDEQDYEHVDKQDYEYVVRFPVHVWQHAGCLAAGSTSSH
jgi:hypothetical protein